MSVLLQVKEGLWINPNAIIQVIDVGGDYAPFHVWMSRSTTDEAHLPDAYIERDEWAAIKPLLVMPPRVQRDENASLTARAVDELLQEDEDTLMAAYAAKQAQDHAALLLHEQTRTLTPDDLLPGGGEEEGDDEDADSALTRLVKVVKSGDFVILDTETTGLNGDAEICQIAIIDPTGKVLLDTLVKPNKSIPSDAARIHGITDEHVWDSPEWFAVQRQVRALLQGKTVIVYNATYDRKMMHQSDEAEGLPRVDYHDGTTWECAMEAYAEHRGVWNDYHGNWRWHKLTDAARAVGYTLPTGIQAHSAFGDCLMTLAVCRKMAGL